LLQAIAPIVVLSAAAVMSAILIDAPEGREVGWGNARDRLR
jgi:hypothetical protein